MTKNKMLHFLSCDFKKENSNFLSRGIAHHKIFAQYVNTRNHRHGNGLYGHDVIVSCACFKIIIAEMLNS